MVDVGNALNLATPPDEAWFVSAPNTAPRYETMHGAGR
jgi:hypothetical protein